MLQLEGRTQQQERLSARPGRMVQATTPNPLITRTKTRIRVQIGGMNESGLRGERLRPPMAARTTRLRISPNFLPAAERSSPSQKLQSRSRPASADSVLDKKCAIPSMERARFTNAKEKAKRRRLRYNSLASA